MTAHEDALLAFAAGLGWGVGVAAFVSGSVWLWVAALILLAGVVRAAS